MVFLDANNWICSVSLDSSVEEFQVVRHFFLPDDWLSSTSRLILDMGRMGEIVFVKRAELAIIKRGLEIMEKGSFNLPKRRNVTPKIGALGRPSISNE
jgi:hypothetical protein